LVAKRTVFLFHLSTNTPAKIPNSIEGMVKASTTPETALLELATLKTTSKSEKFKRFIENWEKNSDAIK
jgi:uncharacterized protein Yka (UPF0111/DUF47 family)